MNNMLKRRPIVGVMGGGETASGAAMRYAYELGWLIAQEGWILLNGGRNCGVMEASARGAKEAGGLTIGILPDDNTYRASSFLDIPIVTDLGNGRNNINVLTSDVIIACQGGAGTLSEIALAIKAQKPVILVGFNVDNVFTPEERTHLEYVNVPEEAIEFVKKYMAQR